MRNITLQEYFDIKGYGIGKKINVSLFAELTGVSISFISKLLNNQYISSKKGIAFKKVEEFIKKDGYQLITGNVIELGMNSIIKENELNISQETLFAIINKELIYQGSKYPLCSIIRTRKFINRGYTINAGQYVKMALELNELDLKDLKIFKDQLVGVDSAYFSMLINSLSERKMKDNKFELTNNYLFEVINRIFG